MNICLISTNTLNKSFEDEFLRRPPGKKYLVEKLAFSEEMTLKTSVHLYHPVFNLKGEHGRLMDNIAIAAVGLFFVCVELHVESKVNQGISISLTQQPVTIFCIFQKTSQLKLFNITHWRYRVENRTAQHYYVISLVRILSVVSKTLRPHPKKQIM